MLEIKGDIFILADSGDYDAICATTNGFVKHNGCCVMGRGIAQTIKNAFPGIDAFLGSKILHNGNHVHHIGCVDSIYKVPVQILSFPVKHNWWEEADINLIKRSCTELLLKCDELNLHKVLLPRPGCGNGKLNWENVKPVIEPLLDNRVCIATF